MLRVPNATYANTTFVRTDDYFKTLILAAERIWKDGIHLQDLGVNILSSNFIKFVNSFLVDNDNDRF